MVRKLKAEGHERLIAAKGIMDKYNLTYQTINHYTNFGLLPLAFKKGNVRFYDEAQTRQRLATITKLAREGYSLRLIRKKLSGDL
ncbi:MAG: MerR family transcriptional regulator [Candidatus Omnitrophica bacterium]|nr:MerR family transcriptional regulator [Candidatus Omnitrophota bacterium]